MRRRDFLKLATFAAGGVAAADALAFDFLAPVEDPIGRYPYRGWEEFYARLWSFDHFGRTTHSVNCTGSCTWRGYVKNGVLFKEEQFGDYPEIGPTVPVCNPRGCQKGANHKEYVYGPQRLKYPLVRAGARGSGLFRRATWAEALRLVADGVARAIKTPWDGGANSPDAVTFYAAIPAKHHAALAGGFRLANLIGGVVCSFYDWYCDLPPGQPLTWGVQTDACESADWVNSRMILVQGANLLETRIPDAHYLTEARYKGCNVVLVAPEYNATSIHADQFVAVKPGTDGALNLAIANVLVSDGGWIDVPYLKRFTDMPFLVRKDNGKFLRASDDPASADFDRYFVWNAAEGKAVVPPGVLATMPRVQPKGPEGSWTLDLGAIDPALEGTFTVNGVEVTTVFSLLKEKLAAYPPEAVAAETGVAASAIRDLALRWARTARESGGKVRIIEGAGTNHYFNNDLINRSQILILALVGAVGKPGGGFDHYVGQEKLWAEHGFFELSFPHGRPRQRFQNTTLWTYVHAESTSDIDSHLPRPLGDYIRESVANGWMPLWPKGTLDNKRSPKVLFVWGANYLNQGKDYGNMELKLWPKLELIVDVNIRMDTTARYADVVLPAASPFERFDLSTTDLHSFVHPFTPVIDKLFECKTDWEIWRELAGALQKTGVAFADTVPDGTTIQRDFKTLQAQFDTFFDRVAWPDVPPDVNVAKDVAACQFLLDQSEETRGYRLQGMDGGTDAKAFRFKDVSAMSSVPADSIAKHPQRFADTSAEWTTDIEKGTAYYAFQRMVAKQRPLTTQTGRQQFYIDHDWFLPKTAANPAGLGEQLPIYRPPMDVDKYPLRWSTPHGRWSVHSTWRDAKYQLRLQRARPVVYVSPEEAKRRGLLDNDLVTIFNGHGKVDAHVYVSPRMPDGLAMMYHGWERYQLNDGWQSPTNIRIKPTQLVGKYGHIAFRLNYWGPTGNQKDTRVEVVFKSRSGIGASQN